MPRTSLTVVAALAVAASVGLVAPPALAGPPACGVRVNNTHAKLSECITVEGVREHQAALQRIADANHGTRVSGSPGYDASVDYVVGRLRAAGYTPQVQSFVVQHLRLADPGRRAARLARPRRPGGQHRPQLLRRR